MESSIAEFLMWQVACEHLPTVSHTASWGSSCRRYMQSNTHNYPYTHTHRQSITHSEAQHQGTHTLA